MEHIRFLALSLLKVLGYVIYPSKLTWLSQKPASWEDVSLLLVLNHTSLFEFVYGVALPFRFLRELSQRLVIPVADVTLQKPLAGFIFTHLAPKTIGISRKRDDSWQQFLAAIEPNDICIFMPEGEMKRPSGLNKHGKPMVVKTGVYELLERFANKNMVIVYSHGLHHVFAPGDRVPRIFRRITASLEYMPVSKYLAGFSDSETPARHVAEDLQRRRDKYCT